MKNYELIPLINCDFQYLVIANSYENPINGFLASSEGISEIKNGKLAVDLLLINAEKHNRFASMSVENSKIIPSSIKIIDDVPEILKNESYKYFAQNQSLIKDSILPDALKFILLNQIGTHLKPVDNTKMKMELYG